MNKALFTYFGNKYREMDMILKNIPNLDEIDTIIEPYAGSFSLIRNLVMTHQEKKIL